MSVLAPKYMERFECIGSACEDTCCSGWRVTLDRESHDALSAAMSESAKTRAEFERKVRRLPLASANEMAYATAERGDQGQCLFVRDDGLCSVHARYGHGMLSNTCSLYPRQIRESLSAVELTAQVSCPEIARQLLLHDDSMDLVALPDDVLERRLASDLADPDDLYARYLDDVRQAMLQFASLPDYSLEERLFFMAFFAHKTAPYFFRGVENDPGGVLAVLLEQFSMPGVLEGIATELRGIEAPLTVTSALVSEIGLVGVPVSPSFARLVERVFATLDHCRDAPSSATFDAGKLAAVHRQRRRRLYALAGKQIDRYTFRFVLNYWLRRWYTESHDLLQHVRDLLVEIAVVQVLLCSHPEILRAVDAAETSGTEAARKNLQRVLERAAVEAFSRTSRCVEHSSLRAIVNERLAEMGLPVFAYTTCLLKFAAGDGETAPRLSQAAQPSV